jgi:hypothetical protein
MNLRFSKTRCELGKTAVGYTNGLVEGAHAPNFRILKTEIRAVLWRKASSGHDLAPGLSALAPGVAVVLVQPCWETRSRTSGIAGLTISARGN